MKDESFLLNILLNAPYYLIVIPIIYFAVRKKASYKVALILWMFAVISSLYAVISTFLLFFYLEGWGLIFPVILLPAALIHFIFLIFLLFKWPITQLVDDKRIIEKIFFSVLGLILLAGAIYLFSNRSNENVSGQSDTMFAWMPDSSRILVAGENNLYFKSASTKRNQLLVKNTVSEGDRNQVTRSIIVSDDGKRAYLSSSQGIFLFDTDNKSISQIFDNPRVYKFEAQGENEGIKILGWDKNKKGFYFIDDYIHDPEFEHPQNFYGDPVDLYYFDLTKNSEKLLLSDIWSPDLSPGGGFLTIMEPLENKKDNTKVFITVVDLNTMQEKQVFEPNWLDEKNSEIRGGYLWKGEEKILVYRYQKKSLQSLQPLIVDINGNQTQFESDFNKFLIERPIISKDGNVVGVLVVEGFNPDGHSDLTQYWNFYNLKTRKITKINYKDPMHFAQFSLNNQYLANSICTDYGCEFAFYNLNF